MMELCQTTEKIHSENTNRLCSQVNKKLALSEAICSNMDCWSYWILLFPWPLPLIPITILHLSVQFSSVSQSCLTLCDPMECSPPDSSSVHGILQARILEWVVILFSRRSSWPRDWIQVSRIAGRFFTVWATREAQIVWPLPEIPLSLPNHLE